MSNADCQFIYEHSIIAHFTIVLHRDRASLCVTSQLLHFLQLSVGVQQRVNVKSAQSVPPEASNSGPVASWVQASIAPIIRAVQLALSVWENIDWMTRDLLVIA